MPKKNDKFEQTAHAPAPGRTGEERSAYLLVLSGSALGHLHKLAPGEKLVLGRGEGTGLRLDDDGVSRRHCTIEARGTGAVLEDLQSQNGTFVDGVKIDLRTLADGDRIQLGLATTLKFTFAGELEAEVQRKLADAALREPLTGLYNRRHFEERLASEVAAARRHERPISLLIVDIDRFKDVNDLHGHPAGDEVLRTVGRVLREATRKEDILARFGGDEFVMLARENSATGARALAELLRARVEAARCVWGNSELQVTVSIGVASCAGETARQLSEKEMFELADRALYRAKEHGRNCVKASPRARAQRKPKAD